ncbi:MAG TPA: hypothetical protein VK645_04690 [Chitinophagaceae bacterium]|nr:hypothetical protein [Chitinophagaceae bacterium]
MKNRLLMLCIALLSQVFSSCNSDDKGQSAEQKKSEPDIAKRDTIPQNDGNFHNFFFKKINEGKNVGPEPIDPPTARSARTMHDEFPLLTDSQGKMIKGFYFKSSDFLALKSMKDLDALYFRMAISNFKDSTGIRNHTVKAQYTIIVVPVDKQMNQLKDANGQPMAFDYVCPCPSTADCCPKTEN